MSVAASPKRILVVDDEEASRLMMGRILGLKGYAVDLAESGAAALNLAKDQTYDLAILDYRMPEMNGVELFEQLQQIQPQTIAIFLTGYPTVDTVFPAISKGAERVLAKPVDTSELLLIIKQLLEQATERSDAP